MQDDDALRPALQAAMRAALAAAERFAGATAPNPPVGAALMDSSGGILEVAAHERADTAHAEARVIQEWRARGAPGEPASLVVTLEPCNHVGRTPPCTELVLSEGKRIGLRRVVIGARDPNPAVAGGGASRLRNAGIEVIEDVLEPECADLIRAFRKWSTRGVPWVTVKTALTREGSMIPPGGSKTFTTEDSLRQAHELRKRADAILTGSGTVLADQAEFTVRRVPDHPGKHRWLAVLDRRGRVPETWVNAAKARGFEVLRLSSLDDALRELGGLGCLEVLVEAGPTLTRALLESGLWDEQVVFRQVAPGVPDQVEVRRR